MEWQFDVNGTHTSDHNDHETLSYNTMSNDHDTLSCTTMSVTITKCEVDMVLRDTTVM